MADLHDLVNRRIDLESALQREKSELSEARLRDYDDQYARLQRGLAAAFKETRDDQERITIMLEMMRILENRLVYLQNFLLDPTTDNRLLAHLVTKFIDQIVAEKDRVLTKLEATYYRDTRARIRSTA